MDTKVRGAKFYAKVSMEQVMLSISN